MGEVHPTKDIRLHRKVALKVLAAKLASDRNARSRGTLTSDVVLISDFK
jgi:hypothetical protein